MSNIFEVCREETLDAALEYARNQNNDQLFLLQAPPKGLVTLEELEEL